METFIGDMIQIGRLLTGSVICHGSDLVEELLGWRNVVHLAQEKA